DDFRSHAHDRAQARCEVWTRRDAEERNARSDDVEMRGRRAKHGRAVRRVAPLGREPGSADIGRQLFEKGELLVDPFEAFSVSAGQMGHEPLESHLWEALEGVEHLGKLVRNAAKTTHAGVHLEVNTDRGDTLVPHLARDALDLRRLV